jgi:diguanylate cyclase (GGDEF)-like protein
VSKAHSSSSTTADRDWRTILGLSEPKDVDWGQVRAAQLNVVREFAITRLVMNVLAACIIVGMLHKTANAVLLYGWFASIITLLLYIVLPKLKQGRWEIATATPGELHRETFNSVLVGLGWAAAPILLGKGTGPAEMIGLWAIATALMGGATFSMSAVPLATSFFLLLVGLGLTGWMWMIHYPLLAITAMASAVAQAGACLALGRTFVLHKAAELALAEKNEMVSVLLREFEDSGGDWMWQIDASKCLTHVSPRFAYALGVEPDALEAQPLLKILAGESWEAGNFSAALRELAEKLKNRESFSDLIIPVSLNSETYWWELSATTRFDERGNFLGFRGVGSDVTEQHKSADKINRMARYDTLTGMPNRLQVTEALGQAMADSDRWKSRCGFMMLDLDRFKSVNDTLGHPIGDRLLTRVSERLRALMSDNEMCGRLGGDEFAVVVKDANDPAKLQRLAQKIIESLSQPYEVDQHTIYIGASVGTATGPRDGRSVEMLIRSADLALYRSKDAGGGVVHAYEPQLHAHAEERRVIEIALRKALENKEFQVHYQPVVNAQSGTIEGFEALLRWTHPELGNVSPAKFVPVAEDARLIGPIGEWVLRTACQEAANWPSTVRIAVNVSAEQLGDPNFVTSVISALSHSGLPPHRLELEVTESVFMREGTGAVAVLDKIVELGVRLSLDDFGTGYSSLGYLSKTKFSTIKVDRSFVQGAAKNAPESLAIIRAVVAMADSLGMSTTAEGVETDEECQMINRLGCRKIQGYLFGRPMPASEARRLFDSPSQRAVA